MKNRGFSLVEAITVIGITALALAALANLFFIFNSVYGHQQAFIAAAGSASAAMNAFEAAVLPAEQVLSSRDFGGTVYASGTTVLVLELPAIDEDGAVIPGVKDYIAFYPSATTLYRLTEAGAGSARISGLTQLSTTLSSVAFTYDDPDFTKVTNVTAEIWTEASFKQQAVRSNLREQLHLRNFQPLP